MVHTYCAQRGLYADPTEYPWRHASHYWMVTQLYSQMRIHGWSESVLAEQAKKELVKMTKRIANGEILPEPVTMLKRAEFKPVSRERGLEIISKLRQSVLRKRA